MAKPGGRGLGVCRGVMAWHGKPSEPSYDGLGATTRNL